MWLWARLAGGVAVLGLIVAEVGSGPFLDGLRRTDLQALAIALGVTAVTTACCAWRWRLVAGALGVRVAPAPSIAAVYRAQLLNVTVPGGVVGDVHRAVRHGQVSGSLGRSARSVAWERGLGQAVQVALTAVVLVVMPSPLRIPAIGAVVAIAMLVVVVTTTRTRLDGPVRALLGDDLRAMLRTGAFTGIVLSSAVACAGHLLVFLVAARTAGSSASTATLLPLAALVLLASALPMNLAGWGPREGVAAWAFGIAGLGTAAGVTTAVVYGVMAVVATLPGVIPLLLTRRSTRQLQPAPVLEEATHG